MKLPPTRFILTLMALMIMTTQCNAPNASNTPIRATTDTSPAPPSPAGDLPQPESTPDSLININYLLGKFDPSVHPLFDKIPSALTTLREGYLRRETLAAFTRMQQAALKDKVNLTIVSATRNFDAQKKIWEAKWNGARKVDGKDLTKVKDPTERALIILRYSSMPGSSRHHWGTDIDINSVEPIYFKKSKGAAEFQWLSKNAATYGFCQTYTPKDSLRPKGYEEEPWHWSYTPISSNLLNLYLKTISSTDIKGFLGEETVAQVRLIKDYVSGINPDCR